MPILNLVNVLTRFEPIIFYCNCTIYAFLHCYIVCKCPFFVLYLNPVPTSWNMQTKRRKNALQFYILSKHGIKTINHQNNQIFMFTSVHQWFVEMCLYILMKMLLTYAIIIVIIIKSYAFSNKYIIFFAFSAAKNKLCAVPLMGAIKRSFSFAKFVFALFNDHFASQGSENKTVVDKW